MSFNYSISFLIVATSYPIYVEIYSHVLSTFSISSTFNKQLYGPNAFHTSFEYYTPNFYDKYENAPANTS